MRDNISKEMQYLDDNLNGKKKGGEEWQNAKRRTQNAERSLIASDN
jgi:hypothetical protein